MVAYASSKAAILAMTVATAKVCSTCLCWDCIYSQYTYQLNFHLFLCLYDDDAF